MSTLFTALEDGIRAGAIIALGNYSTAPIIFSHGNGDEPAESYVVINILNIQQQGHHATSTLTETDRKLPINVAYEALVQYDFVGSLSGNMVHEFNQHLGNNPLVIEEFRKHKIGYMRKSQIRRIPQKRETQWVEYFNIDVTFNYIVNTLQPVDTIETVVIQDVINDVTFTVPPDAVLPPP